WRRRLRQALVKQDREAIRRLAREPLPANLSPSTAMMLAGALKAVGEAKTGLEMLRQAQQRSPGDFWLSFERANAAGASGPQGREEALRYYTAAGAIRPKSAIVQNILGVALHRQGKLAEAVAAYEQAIRLQPYNFEAHNNLGVALHHQGKQPEAVAALG